MAETLIIGGAADFATAHGATDKVGGLAITYLSYLVLIATFMWQPRERPCVPTGGSAVG